MDNKTPSQDAPLSPEEIRAIGEVNIGPAKHEVFLDNHYKKLIVGGIILAVGVVGGIAYYSMQDEKVTEASAALVSAMGADKAEFSISSAKLDSAKLETVAAQYPDTASTDTAKYLAHAAAVAKGKTQQGIAGMNALLKSTANEDLKLRIRVYLADQYTQQGRLDDATRMWQEVVVSGESPYLPLAYMSLGDIAQQQNDKEKAKTMYQAGVAKSANSSLHNRIKDRLEVIDVAPPVKEAPAPLPAPLPSAADSVVPSLSAPLEAS